MVHLLGARSEHSEHGCGIGLLGCHLLGDDCLHDSTGKRYQTMGKQSEKQIYWTHPSVAEIAKDGDPIAFVTARARDVVFSAIQAGWKGPPFDPFDLARLLHIETSAVDSVLDARIVAHRKTKFRVDFNPNRSKRRVWYSIAHEVAHSLFPDCGEYIRERKQKEKMRGDDWQLEMLCNIGAAELLMPIGTLGEIAKETPSIDRVLDLRRRYGVSTEAVLLRLIRLTENPCIAFCCSRRQEDLPRDRYEIDYAVTSKTTDQKPESGYKLPRTSVIRECTGIGYTAKADETWPGRLGKVRIECVGLPPYPGERYPRVAGLAMLPHALHSARKIRYLKGDATEPRGDDKKLVAFIINDKGRSWGAGFARAVQRKWPFVLEEFQTWIREHKSGFALGNVNSTMVEPDLMVCEMVAQRGYGKSIGPRIRYGALQSCLAKVAAIALEEKASVHMPRIGCGQAGGSWLIIRELIESILVQRGVDVTIYDLPDGRQKERRGQMNFLDGPD